MQLGDRKKKILQAIIQDYIETAEPVGSRTISKKHMQELSSATIRNEMADLEEMGYLEQPHTSAGRIPSDLGYRIFVDSMLEKYKLTLLEMVQMQDAMSRKMMEANRIVSELSSVLSHLTKYAAVGMTRQTKKGSIRNLQIMPIDDYRMVVILITNEGLVKNRLFIAAEGITAELAQKLSDILNEKLAGLTISEITLEKINDIKRETGAKWSIINDILEFVAEIMTATGEEVIVDGSVNLLSFPEYSDINKAKKLLEFINNKKNINSLAALSNQDNQIRVIIGNENPFEEFKDCSIILCNYNFGGNCGSIGLVGPTRMDYSKAISMLEYLKNELGKTLD